MLEIAQIGFNTCDMAGSLRLYSEAFGFANAGSQVAWGGALGPQDLKHPDACSLIWWLVGSVDPFQLEFFQHSRPIPRPLPMDWRPCDLGWVRIGVLVDDIDRCVATLARNGVRLLGPVTGMAGSRSAVFRDPYIGMIVEVIEQGEGRVGGELVPDLVAPAVVYAVQSVSDLASARHCYETAYRLECRDDKRLHQDADEARWGLAGASRESFLFVAGKTVVEVVRYSDPVGRPRREDHRMCDQGIANVAFGSAEIAEIDATLERLATLGLHAPCYLKGGDVGATYINDPEREIELMAIPAWVRPALGFQAAAPFVGLTDFDGPG